MADQNPSPIPVNEASTVIPRRLARILGPLYESDVLIADPDTPWDCEHIKETDHRSKEVAAVAPAPGAKITRDGQLEEA